MMEYLPLGKTELNREDSWPRGGEMRYADDSSNGKGIVLAFLFVGALAGLGVLIFDIIVKVPRADESSTFFSTTEGSLTQLWNLLRMGLDSSYSHATLLWLVNKILPPSIYLQRFVSLGFWGLALWEFYRLMRNAHFDMISALVGTFVIGLGSLGRFVAVDGRFYSLLLFVSVVYIRLVANLLRQSSTWNAVILFGSALLGFFTNPTFLLVPMVNLIALVWFVLVNRQAKPFRALIYSCLASGLAATVFLILNWESPVLGLLTRYSYDVQRVGLRIDWLYGFRTIGQWGAWPNSPFVPFSIEFGTTVIICAALLFDGYRARRKLAASEDLFLRSYLITVSIAVIVLVFAQTILGQVIALQPITIRYYVPIMFSVAILLVGSLAHLRNFRRGHYLLVLIVVGLAADSLSYLGDIPTFANQRQSFNDLSAELFNSHAKTTIVVGDSGERVIRFYGQLFLLFPEYRDRMIFAVPDAVNNPSWIQYVRLTTLYYPHSNYRFYYSQVPEQTFANSQIIVSKDDPRIKRESIIRDLRWEGCVLIDGSEWITDSQ